MNPNDPNVAMMELVAARLGEDLREQLVFVGGAVAGLQITDPAQPTIRPTEDVDLIVEVAARVDYQRVEERLRKRGFVNDVSADAPICRWRVDAVTVDVMPTLEEILGFSNRWYPLALATARKTRLPSGTEIRLVTAPAFVATKFEAFAGRGRNDYLFSHDLGDLISILDGRDELIDECRAQGERPAGNSRIFRRPARPLARRRRQSSPVARSCGQATPPRGNRLIIRGAKPARPRKR